MSRAILNRGIVVTLVLAVLWTGAFATAAEPSKAAPRKMPEKLQSATGTIARLDAADRAFVVVVSEGSQTTFHWTPQTKINGTLSQGAKVTIRFTTQSDGQNIAQQISIAR